MFVREGTFLICALLGVILWSYIQWDLFDVLKTISDIGGLISVLCFISICFYCQKYRHTIDVFESLSRRLQRYGSLSLIKHIIWDGICTSGPTIMPNATLHDLNNNQVNGKNVFQSVSLSKDGICKLEIDDQHFLVYNANDNSSITIVTKEDNVIYKEKKCFRNCTHWILFPCECVTHKISFLFRYNANSGKAYMDKIDHRHLDMGHVKLWRADWSPIWKFFCVKYYNIEGRAIPLLISENNVGEVCVDTITNNGCKTIWRNDKPQQYPTAFL